MQSFKDQSFFHRLAVFLLLLWMGVAGILLALWDSQTTDEHIHLASGYTALTRHDFRFDPEHPFLFKMISALPVVLLHPNNPPDDKKLWEDSQPLFHDTWEKAREWADQWLYKSGNSAEKIIFWGRFPAVICLVLLGLLIYYSGSRWFSRRIGLYALFIAAFSPTLLAHGHLANTDLPVALASLWFFTVLWNFLQKPSFWRVLMVGIALAAAILTKFSAIYLVPVLILSFTICLPKTSLLKRAGHFLLILLITWILIWIAYLGTIHPEAIQFGTLRFLLPSAFVKGIFLVGISAVGSRSGSGYLFGQFHPGSLWYYFPVVFALKTQVMGLILLITGFIWNWRNRTEKITPVFRFLLLAAGTMLFFSLTNKLNIGIRHILPLVVLACFPMAIGLGHIIHRFGRTIGILIMIAYALPVIWQSNNIIGFHNSFVHPPERSWYFLTDSNLDWGQQSEEIASVVQTVFENDKLYINYQWGGYVLPYYGIQTESFDAKNPPRGVLIAVTAFQFPYPEYAEFRTRKPIYQISNHTFFYRLP